MGKYQHNRGWRRNLKQPTVEPRAFMNPPKKALFEDILTRVANGAVFNPSRRSGGVSEQGGTYSECRGTLTWRMIPP